MNVVTEAKFLGGIIGNKEARSSFISNRVEKWSSYIEKLSSISLSQPRAAYVALTRVLQSEWTFLQRVLPSNDDSYEGIERAINNSFLPSLFGSNVTQNERLLLSLPVRMGGLNIKNPSFTSSLSYKASRDATSYLVNVIKENQDFESEIHFDNINTSKKLIYKEYDVLANQKYQRVISEASDSSRRTLLKSRDCLSAWLLVPPIEKDNFDLSANEFRMDVVLNYNQSCFRLPKGRLGGAETQ